LSRKALRQPIVVVLGHVDHGKTTLLDKIRGTAIVKKEPGEMTQEVGASLVPSSVIEKVAEPIKKVIPVRLEIPGLLFIDTPGHELFSNLRRRGGSVADIAILVVDLMEGFQRQTTESVEILKSKKVPFIVAANKVDRIPGWKPQPNSSILDSMNKQSKNVLDYMDRKLYDIVLRLSELGLSAERFDRIKDFTKAIAVVPVSGKTGEGLPELLALLAGLTQHFMKGKLKFAEGPAKGVVMEVKEEPGLGTTVDVIIYEGILKKNDIIVLGGLNGAIITRVRGILLPKPLQDLRISRSEFAPIDEVYAASGVKVLASNLEDAVAGAPLLVAESEDKAKELAKIVEEEIQSLKISKNVSGVVVKADSLGGLEAMIEALNREGIPIRLADVGPVSKRDVIEAELSGKDNTEYGAILAFKVKVLPNVDVSSIKLFQSDIIYQVLEEYKKWINELRELQKRRTLESIVLPGKLRIIPGYVFRRSDPAIVGVEVVGGVIRPSYPLMRGDGKRVGEILQIQDNKKTLDRATRGMSVAVSIKGDIVVGRNVEEGEVLYTDPAESDLQVLLTQFKREVSQDMEEVIREVVKVKRKVNPLFALSLGY
jgi:translation initiation factor 5B